MNSYIIYRPTIRCIIAVIILLQTLPLHQQSKPGCFRGCPELHGHWGHGLCLKVQNMIPNEPLGRFLCACVKKNLIPPVTTRSSRELNPTLTAQNHPQEILGQFSLSHNMFGVLFVKHSSGWVGMAPCVILFTMDVDVKQFHNHHHQCHSRHHHQ